MHIFADLAWVFIAASVGLALFGMIGMFSISMVRIKLATERKQNWYRLHKSTLLIMPFLIVALIAANLCSYTNNDSGIGMTLRMHAPSRGFPFPYVQEDHGDEEFHPGLAAVDAYSCFVMLLLSLFGLETFARWKE